MEKLIHYITLIHVTTNETREAHVLSVSTNWKLHCKLGFAGDYWFFIKTDRLYKTEHSRIPIQWRAFDKEHVEDVWKNLDSRGVYYPDRLAKHISNINLGRSPNEILARRVAKIEEDLRKNPSEDAIEWSLRQR